VQAKKIAALIAALALAGATAPTAALAGPPEKGKCNSGNGNGSEPDATADCDPGNSGSHNSGGD
jgi:hypothetical protein